MSNQTLPLAVLGGGALIGLGLYFGLRERPPPADATSAKALPAANTAPAPPEPSELHQRSKEAVQLALKSELDRRHAALVDHCWKPLAAKDPDPASAKLSWNGTIGASGKPVAYGVSEHRDAYRAGLAECVQKDLLSLQVPPPGSSVQVSVDIQLP
ncbi:MAG: hypothetical protein KC776_32480 [Myxococcales bacterium]|nr:hypothetical protein [Myxococcales bacterium]MCB9581211.1 hypothetical protein [Polyangiaceae bacterium]